MYKDNMGFFVEKLRRHIPAIEGVQVLTSDGMILFDETVSMDEDKLSALTALLSSGATRLASCLESGAANGLFVCMDRSAYAVININQDFSLGIQTPNYMGQRQLFSAVREVIDANRYYFTV
jgi:predicted regulator of Ras-like GTPase activity (Roadblock/LC7/MglB family)